MFRAWGKVSSTPAANLEFKHISRVTGPSNRFWASPKTRTPNRRRVVSFIVTNAQLWTVGGVYQRNIQDPGGEVQGTPKGTLPHPGTQSTYRTLAQPGQLQHNRQGGPEYHKIN